MEMNRELTQKIRPVILAGFGPAPLACIRSWGRLGFAVGMIGIKYQKAHFPSSRFLKSSLVLPEEKLYTTEGIEMVGGFLKEFHASGITCAAERVACWLNDNRQVLPPGVGLWLPENKTIHALLSKQKQIQIAREVGFDVLPTYHVHHDIDGTEDIPPQHFPLCLRPTVPETTIPAFKVHLVHSQEDLKKFMSSLTKIEHPLLAQPFRNLANLVVHGARTLSGESIGLQAFLVERKFQGVTLTIRPTHLEEEWRDKCVRFTDSFSVTGNYHFEFLIDKKDGAISFLELNNRFGGTTAKVYACGYDEPLLALQAYGVIPVSPRMSRTRDRTLANVTVSSKRTLLKYLRHALQNKLTPLDYPIETKLTRILKTLYGLLRYRDDTLSFQDMRGSLVLHWGVLRNMIKKYIHPTD